MTTCKRLFAIILFAMLLTSVVSLSALVGGPSGVVEEDLSGLTPESQYQEALNNPHLSAEELEMVAQKCAFLKLTPEERAAQINGGVQTASTISEIYVLDGFATFKQENDYWCGPATVKQTIHYLTDGEISPSQAEIAAAIGTTTSGSSSTRMAKWLAAQGFQYTSIPVKNMTERDLVTYVALDLGTYDRPTFGAVCIPETAIREEGDTLGWYYDTNGHFLNITEVWHREPDIENSLIYVSDPYIEYVKPKLWGYHVSAAQYAERMTSFWY